VLRMFGHTLAPVNARELSLSTGQAGKIEKKE
jgi:hypothetical protein